MGHRHVSDRGRTPRRHGEILSRSFPHRVFIGLGSNIGDRNRFIANAIHWLRRHDSILFVRVTGIVETPPWGNTDQPPFLNAVAEVQTDLEPEPLLAELKGGEQVIGRGKPIIRWGPREIDLDILLFEDRVLHTANLIIPHPALRERDFVIRHLIELNANLRDPETGRFLSEYL